MFYFDKMLQYPVKVETPDPIFARMLQQAIGGIEGEIRVCMQYFFQAWGARGPTRINCFKNAYSRRLNITEEPIKKAGPFIANAAGHIGLYRLISGDGQHHALPRSYP